MESKTLQNVSVIITDEENKINPGTPISVKLIINKEENRLLIEKVPAKKELKETSIPLCETKHKIQVSYQQKAKKIHLWCYLNSEALKVPETELRNELNIAFDSAISNLRKIEV